MKPSYMVIADNLPTWLEWYKRPPDRLPSRSDLDSAAIAIVFALEKEGYRIEKVNGK